MQPAPARAGLFVNVKQFKSDHMSFILIIIDYRISIASPNEKKR